MNRLILSGMLVTLGAFSQAKEVSPCSQETVQTISTSSFPRPLKFQVLPGTDPTLPTLIYLQGGPGSQGIKTETMDSKKGHPFTTVRMDLRGTWCNVLSKAEVKSVTITSDQFVEDWMKVINKLALKKIIIFGSSYGTQLGTLLAARLGQEKDLELVALILEGTIGKAKPGSQFSEGFPKVLNDMRTRFSEYYGLSEEQLKSKKPYGFSEAQWARIVVWSLSAGVFPDQSRLFSPVHFLPSLIDSKTQKSEIQTLRSWFIDNSNAYRSKKDLPKYQLVYEKISCEEDNPAGVEYDFTWKSGNLVPPNKNFCTGKYKFIRPYDSNNYVVKAPVFYFEGSADPNTPLSGALEHFNSQIESERTFVQVGLAGHGALSNALSDCKDQILLSIATKSSLSKGQFEKCTNQLIEIKYSKPQ